MTERYDLDKQHSHIPDNHAVALHSADYVARYVVKPLDRIRNLVSMIDSSCDARVADFGCGNGMLLHALGDSYLSYDGVDFSNDFICAAKAWAEREGKSNYAFHHCDIRDFCAQRQRQFNIATTLDFSEHVEDDLAVEIYSSIRSSMTDGGILYLHTPNLEFFVERAKQFGILKQFPEHVAVRTGEQTRELLIGAGFDCSRVSIEAIPHYNNLKYLHPLSALPIVGRWFAARLWITARC